MSTSIPAAIPQLKVVFCGGVQEDSPRYTEPLQVAWALRDDMLPLDREAFYTVHLNGSNRIISKELISLGTLNQTFSHPREVFKGALLNNSAAIVVAHNHPSGNPEPSREDHEITRRLKECGEILGVPVLDHIIMGFTASGGFRYFSFTESGTMTLPVPRASVPERPKREWLVNMRKEAGMTQKKLAELAGLKHQAVISDLESGYKDLSNELEAKLRIILHTAFREKVAKASC